MKYCFSAAGITLPERGDYATGIFFLDKATAAGCEDKVNTLAEQCHLKVI